MIRLAVRFELDAYPDRDPADHCADDGQALECAVDDKHHAEEFDPALDRVQRRQKLGARRLLQRVVIGGVLASDTDYSGPSYTPEKVSGIATGESQCGTAFSKTGKRPGTRRDAVQYACVKRCPRHYASHRCGCREVPRAGLHHVALRYRSLSIAAVRYKRQSFSSDRRIILYVIE